MDLRRRRPNSGLLSKRDTPSRTSLRRINKKMRKKIRLSPRKIYETLKEESEEDGAEVKANHLLGANIESFHSKPVLCQGRLSCAENAGTKPPSPAALVYKRPVNRASPAGHTNIQVTPIQEAFRSQEMTPESNASSSMDTDTFNPGDEEDCSSHVSITPSSLPSPEIFRNVIFPTREDQLCVHLHVQNSTLLDITNAKTIQMHHSPNLSSIDASTIFDAKKIETIQSREAEPEIKTPAGLSKSVTDGALERKSTPKLSNRKCILVKKKVCFQSPLISETLKVEHTPITVHKTSQLSPPEQIKHEADFSSAGEISFKASPLQVILQRPVYNPEKAMIFDFIDDQDRNAYFQKMRERCIKLQSLTFFPFEFAANTSSSGIGSKKNSL